MLLHDFDYRLPQELIAQEPLEPRDQARLLVYNRQKDQLIHSQVKDIASFLPPSTHLVVNNSRVRKARLFAATTNGKAVEVVVLEAIESFTYRCLIGGKGVGKGDLLIFFINQQREIIAPFKAVVVNIEPNESMGTYVLTFEAQEEMENLFELYGHTPLPPYIHDAKSADSRYQNVYSKDIGSAAAPTAGLHFTEELITDLKATGFFWHEVTLHVGMGTFLPLRKEEISQNTLHTEQTIIPEQVAAALTQARLQNEPLLAVGTTSTRTLESHTLDNGTIAPGQNATQLFIYPGYQFKAVNHLLTNFHLPHSSLLLLVAAFLGNDAQTKQVTKNERQMIDLLHFIYAQAIAERYRFFSFGDAMLII